MTGLGTADLVDTVPDFAPPAEVLDVVFKASRPRLDRPLYVLIDEYDHFTQSLLATSYPEFRSAVGRGGFYRTFFEVIKTAARNGVVQRSFITGVTPVTLYLSSISLERDFGVGEFISMLFYMGVVTIAGPAAVGYELVPPNQVVRDIHLRALFELLDDSIRRARAR